jgi:hypothetical protein
VLLVEALRGVQRAFRAHARPSVRLALQRREVVGQRGVLARGLALLRRNPLAGQAHGLGERRRALQVEDAVGLGVAVLRRGCGVDEAPFPKVFGLAALEARPQHAVRSRAVRQDLVLARHEHRERRRLDAPGRPARHLVAALEPLR